MINVDEIKSRISCPDYLQQYAGVTVESGKRCVSPIRSGAKNPTSFYVTDEFFFDFGLAQGGDVIDLCALHKFDGNRGRAIYFFADVLNIKDENYDPKAEKRWLQYTNNLNNKVARWHANLTMEDINYIHSRGISDEIISRYRIGRTSDGRLSLPYYKNGYCCYYATRAMPNCKNADKKYMKMPIDDYNEHIVFGLDTVTNDRSLIVIAEGMFDCLSFIDSGYTCISAITGHFSGAQLKTVLPLLKTYKRVLIVYDNDERTHAGAKFTYKMANILAKNQIPFLVGQVPKGFKDISEMYANRHYYKTGIKQLIDDATDGITFLVKQLDNEEDFADFMVKTCRGMSDIQIYCIFDKIIKGNAVPFDKSLIKEVKKKCLKPPTEEEIAKEITEENRLLYNPAIGHFIWNGKMWEKVPAEIINAMSMKKLGSRSSGSKLSSILKLINSLVITDEVFNNKPVLNFQNGALELEGDFKFRGHQQEDMCTYCLSYNYNEESDFSEWEKFIESVTDGDELKAACLQEFAGYILYPDNSMQRALCCIGGGANGKSVFLNVISKAIGKENVSNVEMSAFSQDFQRIKLMNAMLNISSETRSNVAQAESYFKSIVAGDTCSACYKGKDYVEFIPRAKVIMSCNEYLKPHDTSDGFLRRLLFVKFPVKFCDNPNPERNEKPIDRSLESKFSKPEYLSGIMNWIISGYRQLKAVGEFTQPTDSHKLVEEFTALTNPIIDFLAEFTMPTNQRGFRRITVNDFYYSYVAWCANSGHKPASKRKFGMEVIKLLPEHRPDIFPYRTSGERGYELATH